MAQAPAPAGSNQGGLPYALGAYAIWGFVPLFFKLLTTVPPVEVLAQRIVWSLPLCFLIMAFRRQIGEYFAALKVWRALRLLLVSSVLIAVNWLVYIYAIFTDHVPRRRPSARTPNAEERASFTVAEYSPPFPVKAVSCAGSMLTRGREPALCTRKCTSEF